MPGPREGWLYLVGPDGSTRELINHARTAAYLQNVELPNGMLLCNVLDFGGCESYTLAPPCEPDSFPAAHVLFPAVSGPVNELTVPDAVNLSAPSQLDIRFAVSGIGSVAATRTIIGHWESTTADQRSYLVQLDAAGAITIRLSTNGTEDLLDTCDEPLVVGDLLVLGRVTWRSSDGRIQFFRKPTSFDDIEADEASNNGWYQIGSDEVGPTAALHNSTSTPRIGVQGTTTSTSFRGRLYSVWVATTINGPAVLSFGPSDIPQNAAATSLTAATGQTVTVTRAGSGDQLSLVYPGIDGWSEMSLLTPSTGDTAPWYNSEQPESAEALGFFIDDWTGLGNDHVHRNVAAKGGWGGGAQLGPLSAGARTMAFGVQMFASSAEGMEYLFRWLEQTLYNVCDTCATDGLLIRRFCGSMDDPWKGVARLNDVGLTAGPNWENELLQVNQCYYRRISFVLTAGDPCMYLPGTEFAFTDAANLTQCFDDVGVDSDRNPCRPACIELSANNADCRQRLTLSVDPVEAAVAPVVTLENTTTEYTVPTRVLVYYDPAGVAPTNPCSLQLLGELYVRPIRPGATLVWDVAAREVNYRDHTTGLFVPGWAYTDPNDPPVRRWFTLPCGDVEVVLEPSTLCLTDLGGGSYTDGDHTFDAPAFPSPSVELVPRVGCP